MGSSFRQSTGLGNQSTGSSLSEGPSRLEKNVSTGWRGEQHARRARETQRPAHDRDEPVDMFGKLEGNISTGINMSTGCDEHEEHVDTFEAEGSAHKP